VPAAPAFVAFLADTPRGNKENIFWQIFAFLKNFFLLHFGFFEYFFGFFWIFLDFFFNFLDFLELFWIFVVEIFGFHVVYIGVHDMQCRVMSAHDGIHAVCINSDTINLVKGCVIYN
jgi:hypothetical protein